ncbi:MAG: tetratricopeptide repeat protein, partial [Candidatus Latescibacterota bacterium]
SMATLAKIYADAGEKAKAMELYERAMPLATGEEALKIKSQLGRSYIESEDYEKSAAIFDELAKADPEKASHRFNLGISHLKLKAFDKAVPEFEKAVELEPGYGDAYQYLAISYNQVKQYNKAIEAAKKGLEVAEKKAGLYCAWGKSLEKLQLYDEAVSRFEKAVNDPQWGSYARKQIQRQIDLKKRAEAIRQQQG